MSPGVEDDEIEAELQGHEFLTVKDFYGSTVLFSDREYLKANLVFYSSLHDKASTERVLSSIIKLPLLP